MVTVAYDTRFKRTVRKIKDVELKKRIKRRIKKIVEFPKKGKPMRYMRKNTREVRISPFRLSYMYLEKKDKIIFLELYHKDEQ